MPLDLALALLRDPQGDIALPIPIEYGAQGASANIGTILLGALRAAITGAVTSPIKALGVYRVPVRLHADVKPEVRVWVIKQ